MTHAPPVLVLSLVLAWNSCGDDDGGGHPPPPNCSWHYEMVGDSEENAHFYDEDNREIQEVVIEASDRCDTVTVELEHRGAAARLIEPSHACVRSMEGENTNLVSFVFDPTCNCEDRWGWIVTDKAPPVTLQLQIKTVPGCDPG